MNTNRQPDSFDPRQWRERVGPLLPSKYGRWSTRDVIGPRDACWVVHMRELLRDHMSLGPGVPADLFLLGFGEGPVRDCTKIGGLPFWPHDRAWPESEGGRPLPFLAQFCFRESRDIVGDLPEEMLLLFGDKDDPSNVVAQWQSLACRTRLIDYDEMPVEPIAASFYGVRWRTENYPDAEHDNNEIVLADGTTVSDEWFVCELMGMQIGSHPFFPRWEGRPAKTERTVCAMSAVFPIPGFPWPFINRSSPLTEQEVEQLSLDLCEIKDADGFGVLCVVVSDSGEPEVLFENL